MNSSRKVSWGEVAISDIRQIRDTAKSLSAEIVDRPSRELIGDVAVVVSEVATNAVRHAISHREKTGIELWLEQEGNHLIACVKNGSHFDHGDSILPRMRCGAARMSARSLDLKKEGGMGLSFIGALVVAHSVSDDGTMRLHLPIHKSLVCLPLEQASLH